MSTAAGMRLMMEAGADRSRRINEALEHVFAPLHARQLWTVHLYLVMERAQRQITYTP